MMTRFIGAVAALLLLTSAAVAQFTEQRVWGGTSGGSANAQTLTIANMPGTVPTGVPIRFVPGASNTGATTLTIAGGSGAKSVFKPTAAGPVALSGGELIAGQVVEVIYNGTQYQIVSNTDAAASQIRVTPQGYLTPCPAAGGVSGCTAGSPVATGDVSAATTLYYTPFVGNQIPIWNGSNMVVLGFSELTITIPSSRLANTIYDVCVFNNSGAVTAAIGPAWSNSGAGAGTRGTGAGTAELARVQGLLVNAVQISAVNGANNYTISANLCTYVGSIYMDGTNGQVTIHITYGTSRKRGVWNAYNRQPVFLQAGDSTASWTYTTATFRAARGQSTNSLTVFSGLPDENYSINYRNNWTWGTPVSGAAGNIGIGWNSTTVASGFTGASFTNSVTGSITVPNVNLFASLSQPPSLGINVVTALEKGGTTATMNGTAANMVLTAWWRG